MLSVDDGDDDGGGKDGGKNGDLRVVYAALGGPHCKLETLRSVPVEEFSHDDNTNMNTLLDGWLV